MQDYLFSYGTLQNESVQRNLFGRVLRGTKDVVKGYKSVSIEIKDKAFLARGEQPHQQTAVASGKESDEIEGTAFEITNEELAVVDDYEPDGYTRIKVKLQSGNEAWLYVAD